MAEKRVLQRRSKPKEPKVKRVLQRKSRRDWEVEIRTCLTSKGDNWDWGCLSKSGELFKILTLSSTVVPKDILNGMVSNGSLKLQTEGTHYDYIPK